MFSHKKYIILITVLTLILSACGAPETEDPAISTAVALTVAAQNVKETATPAASVTPMFTQTPLQFSPTLTPPASVASPTLQGSSSNSECGKASLISETIPDGTIFTPGAQFTKTWEIKNIGNCTWDTSYKIIFWSGDLLGGAYVYNLPQITPPQRVVPISLVLTAPTTEGDYTSEWKLQTPDGASFGVGYNAAFYTEIVVSSDKKPGYAITKVEYQIIRDPATGCPANVTYTVIATVTTNGPLEFAYYWTQKDGNDSSPKTTEVTEAGTTTFKREWKIGLANTPGDKWIEFNISEPVQQSFGRTVFTSTCGQP